MTPTDQLPALSRHHDDLRACAGLGFPDTGPSTARTAIALQHLEARVVRLALRLAAVPTGTPR